MTELLHLDQLVESVDESVVLLGMLRPAGASHPTSALVEAIWNEETHPRWPPHTKGVDGKDIGGQFMRAGETFMADGHRWDIHSIADGRIIANEASGNVKDVETRVFTPQQIAFEDGEHPSLVGATVAPPVKLNSEHIDYGTDQGSGVYNAPILDGDAGHQVHDPSILLPAGSKLTADEWEKFGLADQLYYRELMSRYGPWEAKSFKSTPQGDKIQQVFAKALKEFGSTDAQSIVEQAINSQKSASHGDQLNLVTLFKGISTSKASLAAAQKKYARAREVQSEINGVIAYDLYNRLHSPDISLKHKAPNQEGFFGTVVKGSHAIMSGLSTSWSFDKDWNEPNTLGVAMPIRHLLLSEQITGLGWTGGQSEYEFATADRVKVNPDVAAFWSPAQVPKNDSNPLWKYLKTKMSGKPAPGKVIKDFAAQLSGKADLPGIEQDLNFVFKKQSASSSKAVIPPGDFMKHVEEEIAKNPGKAITDKVPVSTLDLKPGDVIESTTEGLRYLVIENPGAPAGTVTYIALGKGAPGNYDTADKLYMTQGKRKKIDRHFDIPAPKKVNVDSYKPDDWVPGGDAIKIGAMAVGTKLRLPDEYDNVGDWEITNSSSTSVSLKSLTSDKQATVNPLFKIQPLIRVGGAGTPKPGALMKFQNMIVQVRGEIGEGDDKTWKVITPTGTPLESVKASELSALPSYKPDVPMKGDTFSAHHAKYTVTTVLKNGTVKAKPTGGKVESFASDHPALMGLLRPTDFNIGEKTKLKELEPGDLFSGSASAVRPYMVLNGHSTFQKVIKAKNLDTGQVMDLSPNKSYAKLVPTTPAPAEDAPVTGKEWGDLDKPEHPLAFGDKLDGKTWGDLEVGDQFQAYGTTYTIVPGKAGYVGAQAAGSSDVANLTPTGNVAIGAVYVGHVPQPGHESAPSPLSTASPQPGDELMNGLLNLHVGAQFKASNGYSYQIIGDNGSTWNVKAQDVGTQFEWPKNALAGGGVIYTGDAPVDTGPSKDEQLADIVSAWKAHKEQPAAPVLKDAVKDGGFSGFKLAKNHGMTHHMIGMDMGAGDYFVDSKGKWWKKVSQNADGTATITDGKDLFSVDGKARGKIANYVNKPVPDLATPQMPEAAAPAYPQITSDQMKLGDVVALPNGLVIHVTGEKPDNAVSADPDAKVWTIDPLNNSNSNVTTMQQGAGHTKFDLLGNVSPQETSVQSSPVKPAVSAASKTGDLFRASSSYSMPSEMPPMSFVKYKGNIYYKTKNDAWFKMGSKTPTLMPEQSMHPLYPILPSASEYVTDTGTKIGLADVSPGQVIGSPVDYGKKFMVLGKTTKDAHVIDLDDKQVFHLASPSMKFHPTTPVDNPEPELDSEPEVEEPEIATAPSTPTLPDGFVPAPPDTTTANAGLKVGDEFYDGENDHHTVVSVNPVTTKWSYHQESNPLADTHGPSVWEGLAVTAIKNAPAPKRDEDGFTALPTPTPIGELGLQPGDEVKDTDGDHHVVTSVEDGGVYTKWGKQGSHQIGPTMWSYGEIKAVAVKKHGAAKPVDVTLKPGDDMTGMPVSVVKLGDQYKVGDDTKYTVTGFNDQGQPMTSTGPIGDHLDDKFGSATYLGNEGAPVAGHQIGDDLSDVFADEMKPGDKITSPSGTKSYFVRDAATGAVNMTGDPSMVGFKAPHSPLDGYVYAGNSSNATASVPDPTMDAIDDPNTPVTGIPDYDGVQLSGGSAAGGSTGAQIKKTIEGQKWLVKDYGGNQDRIATELLSNAIYREMGIKAANAGKLDGQVAYPLVDGKEAKFSSPGLSAKKFMLGKGFMTDVLVANRDFAGLEDDNVLWNGNEPTRIDQGASFFYRAQGAKKDFDANPSMDLKNFLTVGQGKNGVSVTESGLREQAKQIAATITPQTIDNLVLAAGFQDKSMENAVAKNLLGRVHWMKQFGDGEIPMPSGTNIPKGAPVAHPKPMPEALSLPDVPDGWTAAPDGTNALKNGLEPGDSFMTPGGDQFKITAHDPNGPSMKKWTTTYLNGPSEGNTKMWGSPLVKAYLKGTPEPQPAAKPVLKVGETLGDAKYGDLSVGDQFKTWSGEFEVVGKDMKATAGTMKPSTLVQMLGTSNPPLSIEDDTAVGATNTLTKLGSGSEPEDSYVPKVGDKFTYEGPQTVQPTPVTVSGQPGGSFAGLGLVKVKSDNSGAEWLTKMGNLSGLISAPTMPAKPILSQTATQEADMPIVPYLHHKGGKSVYDELSSLEPGQKFSDKKGDQFEVITHSEDHVAHVYAKKTGQIVHVPHSFVAASGAQAGKTIPTRVKVLS